MKKIIKISLFSLMVLIVLFFVIGYFLYGPDNKSDKTEITSEHKKITADIIELLNKAKKGNKNINLKSDEFVSNVNVSIYWLKFESDDLSNDIVITTDNFFYVKEYKNDDVDIGFSLSGPDISISTCSKDFLKWDEIEFSNDKNKNVSYNVRNYKKEEKYFDNIKSDLKCCETMRWEYKKSDFHGYEALLDGNPIIRFKKNGVIVHQYNVSANTMLKIIDIVGIKQRMDLLPKDQFIGNLMIASKD